MSFGINGPDNHIPSIQKSHHTNDGGAGNLGYFQQEKKKKDEDEEDIFEFSSKQEDEDKDNPLMEELDSIGTRIKGFWNTLKSGFKEEHTEQKNPED